MQRLGGGGYTRKLKRGGGNDPSCGCDMQAGWPKFLTENIPLPSMKGGGSCGIPPIPNYYQGGSSVAAPHQRGGGCAACSGLPLPQPMVGPSQPTIGGGQPTVYNSNPVPDACPFPGTGYCNFYARGGANPVSFSGSVEHNNGTRRTFRGSFNNTRSKQSNMLFKELNELNAIVEKDKATSNPAPVKSVQYINFKPLPFKGKRYIWDTEGKGVWRMNPDGTRGEWVGKISNNRKSINTTARNYIAQGGANYGEPMYLQARLRGGGCGCGGWKGGYRPTKKNLNALKKWRKGQSIGFTQTASLKAKGLIPRTSKKYRGKKVKSAKYR